RIAALDELIVEGVISEYDTLKVEEGQEVVLSSDVVPDEEWKGKVTHIGYLPEQSNSVNGEAEAVQYAVEVAVESEDIPLKPGFQMIMEIETEKRKVPTLPLSAVVSKSQATVGGDSTEPSSEEEEHYVFVVKDGKAERRPVEVGIVSDDRIEIKDGLESDEHVVANPPENLKDGAEVTVK
ncbi:MAG: HlyD family efflux transporter periplasmic adaptor subunit, partial [Novibacillus thermophilus]